MTDPNKYAASIRDIPMPSRIALLPVSPEKMPVPFFVQWFCDGEPCGYGNGVPDFRVADERKFVRALKEKRCWLCGDRLGSHLAFAIGPMCAVNRTTSEPPCHLDCAIYAARACPFLSRPRMRRNEHELPDARVEPAGVGLKRNPGVVCIWITRKFTTFRPHRGNAGVLIHLDDATRVLWYAEGRPATRAEVEASIAGGFPALKSMAEMEGDDAVAALHVAMKTIAPLLPPVAAAFPTGEQP